MMAATEERRKKTRRTLTTVSRVVVGVVVSAGAVLGVAAAAAAPWPELRSEVPHLDSAPEPQRTVLACDGPVLALGRAAENAEELSIAAPVELTAGNAGGDSPAVEPLEQPAVVGDDAPTRLVQDPGEKAAVPAAGASSATVQAEDVAGFAASACRPPQMEQWIVGGDVSTGNTGVLLVANPSDVSATVTVTVHGATGPVTPAGGDAIAIPPRSQVPLPLAGLAGSEQSPVLRVTATGAPVRVSLQSSLVRTLDPGGVDVQPSVSLPEQRHILPGVSSAGDGGDQPDVRVRLLAPGAAGNASVTVSAGGKPVGEVETVALEAGVPVEVGLPDLPKGAYTVAVSADVPVLAAAWQTTGFGQGSDFAWQVPSPAIDATTMFAAPPGPEPSLELSNPSDAPVTVSFAVAGREPRELTVPAGDSISEPLAGDRVYTIEPKGEVRGAVRYLADGAVASFPVLPDPTAPHPVTVYP